MGWERLDTRLTLGGSPGAAGVPVRGVGWLTGGMDLSGVREAYESAGFDKADLADDPFTQFQRWFGEVEAAGYWEPNAMVLSTVTADGWPSARNVLLKRIDAEGFVLFTNYTSDKATEMDGSGRAALTFSWTELRRQVRVMGTAERLTDEESDGYWISRPRGSQLGAWASDQSVVVPDRVTLERAFTEAEQRWADQPVERPDHWGGYRVRPHSIEFWQGRPDRLHDRLRYCLDGGSWVVERRAP